MRAVRGPDDEIHVLKLQPRYIPIVRQFLRDFLIERAVVRPGRGPVKERAEIEFKPHPLA